MIKLVVDRFPYDLYQEGKCVARIHTHDTYIERITRDYQKQIYIEEINERANFLIFNPDYQFETPTAIRAIVEAWADTHSNAGIIICDEYEFESILKFLHHKLSALPDTIGDDTHAALLIDAIHNCL